MGNGNVRSRASSQGASTSAAFNGAEGGGGATANVSGMTIAGGDGVPPAAQQRGNPGLSPSAALSAAAAAVGGGFGGGSRSSSKGAGAADAAGGAGAAGGGTDSANVDAPRRLLEEYIVGQQLGQGAFGVVSLCTLRKTGEKFAVKMVDKVETPAAAIMREAELLRSLNHPNIVKVHGVFNERFFVCIIMDIYEGGDLVEGLQKHLREKGQINCHDITSVMRQMGAGMEYLHSQLVVHRDIKGDNYLSDRPDIVEKDCKVVLTDFGTAAQVKPSERLSSQVGTKIFWSPEFYDRNYSFKVDVFAMGVVMYGLLTGRFPFRDDRDCRNKQVKLPSRVHTDCQDLVLSMLEKEENDRLSAAQVVTHRWLDPSEFVRRMTMGRDGLEEDDPHASHTLRENQVNDGVKERRQVLIDRLNMIHRAREGPIRHQRTLNYMHERFELPDKTARGAKITYEWWSQERMRESGLLQLEARATHSGAATGEAPSAPAHDINVFKHLLQDHNINPDVFGEGQAKTLWELAAEVQRGGCRMMLDATSHKKLVRVVDVVLFRLRSEDGSTGRLLIETGERFADGRYRDTVRLPGTKKEPHENSRQTAERILREMLRMRVEDIEFDFGSLIRFEEETDSPSFPGVRTVYRKEILQAVVKAQDSATLDSIGLSSFTTWSAAGKDGLTKTYEWWTEEMARKRAVKFHAEGDEVVSTLVRAPIGYDEEQLRTLLEQNGVDVSLYGQKGKTRTIREFSAELVRGEAMLSKGPTGDLLRIVDVVMLVIENTTTGGILVQSQHTSPSGHKTTLNRLPGAKSRPDENHFLSARRILRRQLEIDENDAELVPNMKTVEEEKPTEQYPGLKTIYRKRLIRCSIAGPPTPTIAATGGAAAGAAAAAGAPASVAV